MKNYFLLTLGFVFIFQIGFSQRKTLVYYAGNNKPATKENAVRYEKIVKKKSGVVKVSRYIKRYGNWKNSGYYEIATPTSDSTMTIDIIGKYGKKLKVKRKYRRIKGGYYFEDFYNNGNLRKGGCTKTLYPLFLEGRVTTYFKYSIIASIRTYKNNKLISTRDWSIDGKEFPANSFDEVDVMPEYPGGNMAFLKDIANTVKYPKDAMNRHTKGRVYVTFVINEEGEICYIYVKPTGDFDLNIEAYRAIASLKKKWKPGILDGKKVKVRMTVPISFVLS